MFKHQIIYRRVDETGYHAVDPDAIRRILVRHHTHQAVAAGLRSAVRVLAEGEAVDAGGRAGDDDRAALAALEHGAHSVFAGQEHAGQVDGDDLLPDLQLKLVDSGVPLLVVPILTWCS